MMAGKAGCKSLDLERQALWEFDEDIFLGLLFLKADVKIGIFPIPMAYRLGFRIFKEDQDNPDEIGMAGQYKYCLMF